MKRFSDELKLSVPTKESAMGPGSFIVLAGSVKFLVLAYLAMKGPEV